MFYKPKTKEEMIQELEDSYSYYLFTLEEEELRDEYNTHILMPGLKE